MPNNDQSQDSSDHLTLFDETCDLASRNTNTTETSADREAKEIVAPAGPHPTTGGEVHLASPLTASKRELFLSDELVLIDPRICSPFSGSPRAGIQYADARDSELADNIRLHGVLEPIVAWGDQARMQVLSGNRRVAVARHLMETGVDLRVPCRLFRGNEVEALAFAHACNQGREKPTAMEQARAIAWAIKNLPQSQVEIAQALGFDEAKVSRLLTLAELPDFVLRAATDSNALSENFAGKLQSSLADRSARAGMERRAKQLERQNRTLPGPKLAQYLLTGRDETEIRKVEDGFGKLIAQLSADHRGAIQVKITPAYIAAEADWEGMFQAVVDDLKKLVLQTREQQD